MLHIAFADFPHLSTNRLLLRKPLITDAPALYELRCMVEVMQYINRPKPAHVGEAEELIKTMQGNFEANEGITWMITLKEDDKPIGTMGYWRLDKPNHRAEIGYLLHPHYWGKGIASEAMQAVLQYGLHQLQFHSIEANVNPLNEASKNLLLRFGFRQEGYFRENYYFEGKFLDSVIYSLLEKDYKPGGSKP